MGTATETEGQPRDRPQQGPNAQMRGSRPRWSRAREAAAGIMLGALAFAGAAFLVAAGYGLIPILALAVGGWGWPFGLAAILTILGLGLLVRASFALWRERAIQ